MLAVSGTEVRRGDEYLEVVSHRNLLIRQLSLLTIAGINIEMDQILASPSAFLDRDFFEKIIAQGFPYDNIFAKFFSPC